MTNHPNRSVHRPQIIVTRDSDKQVFENLAGVFGRVFPIVVGRVRGGDKPQGVTYYGEGYTVSRAASEVEE